MSEPRGFYVREPRFLCQRTGGSMSEDWWVNGYQCCFLARPVCQKAAVSMSENRGFHVREPRFLCQRIRFSMCPRRGLGFWIPLNFEGGERRMELKEGEMWPQIEKGYESRKIEGGDAEAIN